MPPLQAFFQMMKETVVAFKIKRHFRYQDKVCLVAGERCVRRDKTGIPAHDFYKADAVNRGYRFNMGGFYDFYRFGYRGVKTERTVDNGKIIVNGFGNSNKRNFQFSFAYFFRDIKSAALSAVSADDKHHI